MTSSLACLDDIPNGSDDVWIGRATADIAAHALANLRVGQRYPGHPHVGRYVARPSGLRFGQHADGRTNLPGSAIAALPVVAALLRSGEMQMLAKRIEERRSQVELQSCFPAVDGQFYVRGKIKTLCKGCFGFGYTHVSSPQDCRGQHVRGWET